MIKTCRQVSRPRAAPFGILNVQPLQSRRQKQKKAMNAPHFDVTSTSPSGNGSVCGPTIDATTATLTVPARCDGSMDAWEMFRCNDTHSHSGGDDRVSIRWFLPYIPDPPRTLGSFATPV